MNSKYSVKLAHETCEILFYQAALLRLGRVRELVREINDQHVGTQFIIKRQPAVRYSSTIYFYFFFYYFIVINIILVDVLHDVTERQRYMRYAVFHYALWYGPYVWIGTSQVFTGEIRVKLF